MLIIIDCPRELAGRAGILCLRTLYLPFYKEPYEKGRLLKMKKVDFLKQISDTIIDSTAKRFITKVKRLERRKLYRIFHHSFPREEVGIGVLTHFYKKGIRFKIIGRGASWLGQGRKHDIFVLRIKRIDLHSFEEVKPSELMLYIDRPTQWTEGFIKGEYKYVK